MNQVTGDRPVVADSVTVGSAPPAGSPCVPSASPQRPARAAKPDPDRLRLCVVSRQELPPAALIRFVQAPDGSMVADIARKLPGRGVWVTGTRAAVAEAAKRGLFAKSLKRAAKAGPELAGQVEDLLVADTRQALSLANKAGLITTGFAKVEIALEKGLAAALIAANDASSDGTGKLARKFTAIRTAAGLDAPVLDDFSGAELNLAFGGSNVVHAALAAGALQKRVVASCLRLRRYRMLSVSATPAESDGDAGGAEPAPTR